MLEEWPPSVARPFKLPYASEQYRSPWEAPRLHRAPPHQTARSASRIWANTVETLLEAYSHACKLSEQMTDGELVARYYFIDDQHIGTG